MARTTKKSTETKVEVKEGLKVTTIEDLLKYSEGVAVELSPFSDSVPFVCKLKRPSLLEMAVNGTINNELLPVALELFENKKEENVEEKSAEEIIKKSKEFNDIMKIIARCAMVCPSYEDIESANIELTSEQLVDIYNYVNTGIEDLKFFRGE